MTAEPPGGERSGAPTRAGGVDAPPLSGGHVPAREALAPGHAHHRLALEVRDLWAGYPGQPPAVEGVGLVVPEGELVGLVGPNGAGKSTLFKSILGLLRPLRGEVRVFGRPVDKARSDIAYTPQIEEVDWGFPISVRELVLMGRWRGLRPLRSWSREDREAADAAIERAGLADLAGRQAGELSGGQRRRALVARAIARGARLLLLDEPLRRPRRRRPARPARDLRRPHLRGPQRPRRHARSLLRRRRVRRGVLPQPPRARLRRALRGADRGRALAHLRPPPALRRRPPRRRLRRRRRRAGPPPPSQRPPFETI